MLLVELASEGLLDALASYESRNLDKVAEEILKELITIPVLSRKMMPKNSRTSRQLYACAVCAE